MIAGPWELHPSKHDRKYHAPLADTGNSPALHQEEPMYAGF